MADCPDCLHPEEECDPRPAFEAGFTPCNGHYDYCEEQVKED